MAKSWEEPKVKKPALKEDKKDKKDKKDKEKNTKRTKQPETEVDPEVEQQKQLTKDAKKALSIFFWT